jgi:hypothetical protein
MPKYQGHKDWNHWNVSLWINSDEALYRMAKSEIIAAQQSNGTRNDAAERMLVTLSDIGVTHTPDGAPYTCSSIRAAMREM